MRLPPLVPRTLLLFVLGLVLPEAAQAAPCTYTILIPMGYSMIANQCDDLSGNNLLDNIFPGVPNGSLLIKWNKAGQFFEPAAQYNGVSWAPATTTLDPGEGGFFFNPAASFNHTFNGNAHTPVPLALVTGFCIASRQEPLTAGYNDIVGQAPVIGDCMYRFDGTNYTRYTFAPLGGGTWIPPVPVFNVGESVWICRGAGAAAPPTLSCSYTIQVPSGYSMIANQCDHPSGLNTLNNIMPIVPECSQLIKWNKTTQSFEPVALYQNGVWFPDPVLDPGEGGFFYNPSSTFPLSFNGNFHPSQLPLSLVSGFCIASRQEPLVGGYDDIVGLPPVALDKVFRFNGSTYNSYTFIAAGGGVWVSSAPMANVGESVWIQRGGGASAPPPAPPICNCVTITAQPQSLTLTQPCCLTDSNCATFSVAVDPASAGNVTYQWCRNGLAITGANGPVLTYCSFTLADNGAQFTAKISNACTVVTSDVAILTVVADFTPPILLSVTADCESNKVTLVFDECVDPSTALDPYSYFINPAALVLAANPGGDERTVCLSADDLQPGVVYTLTATGIKDYCGNEITSETQFSFQCPTNPGCLRITNEVVTCLSNGGYTYSFTAVNDFSGPISWITLVDLPAGAAINGLSSGAVLFLDPPVPTGQSTNLTVMIGYPGPVPANFCFRFTTHNLTFEECCAIEHCLELPACCSLISDDVLTCDTNQPGRYTFQFSYQNLFDQPVSYLIVWPETNFVNCVTGRVVYLSPPLQTGQSTTITTSLDVATNCGPDICLRISAHRFDFVQCCSMLHYITLPNCHPAQTSGPRIDVAIKAGGIILSMPTEAGVACKLEFTDSLTPTNWKLFRTITGDGEQLIVMDSFTNSPCRFYRVRTE